MKKIMILAVAAMAVFAANAAQMKWGSGALKAPTTTANLTANYGGAVALYVIDSTTYSTITAAIAGMSGNEASKYLYNQFSTKEATQTSTTFSKGANTLTENKTYAAGDSAYAVLIYTAYDSTAKDEFGKYTGEQYYIANAGSWTFEADATKTMANMGTNLGGNGAAITWQAVPEPTSGLLLLLGVAGLALRRKRA